ncbi:unnamed protein product [Acanthoscelides obtectus]|uniref:Uncharacterized protein n=1 Tax=Acanthoscelides obtectus TaxID=200917 RepID=A0A9P0LZQ0_ACAOB|nr:unnamed protein product [Acanthoscelides obtectus]CAK1669439.1 hypothetical protein AOBTE_LOCUS27009 [Acanthoscelides obtectus]
MLLSTLRLACTARRTTNSISEYVLKNGKNKFFVNRRIANLDGNILRIFIWKNTIVPSFLQFMNLRFDKMT